MLKLNRLFSTVTAPTFYDAITPTREQRALLESAKNAIRDYLRKEIHDATVSELGMAHPVTPRFRTQGSWSYGTCCQPAWPQTQQIDWDFGVYLPVTVWETNGPPHAMARRYFDLVEKRLTRLCQKMAWKLVPGKNTCIRIEVAAPYAHIDLPLYAAPEQEFERIYERLIKAQRSRADSAVVTLDSAEEQDWEDLKQLVLAQRSGEWKASDPEKIARWFRDRLLEHTDQLQRVCMYLKAWRDFHYPAGDGPTSVCIMVAIATDFQVFRGRDDLALEAAAAVLSRALSDEVRCQGVDGCDEDFNKRLNDDEKAEAVRKAAALAAEVKRARLLTSGSVSAQQAIRILTAQLGVRIPQDANQVDSDGGEDIRSTPARRVPPPVVKSTQAG
jgi:hypothetical protein